MINHGKDWFYLCDPNNLFQVSFKKLKVRISVEWTIFNLFPKKMRRVLFETHISKIYLMTRSPLYVIGYISDGSPNIIQAGRPAQTKYPHPSSTSASTDVKKANAKKLRVWRSPHSGPWTEQEDTPGYFKWSSLTAKMGLVLSFRAEPHDGGTAPEHVGGVAVVCRLHPSQSESGIY